MANKISTLSMVNDQGSKSFVVGREYKGLKLYKIENETDYFEDSVHVKYSGYTVDNELVFINSGVPCIAEFEDRS